VPLLLRPLEVANKLASLWVGLGSGQKFELQVTFEVAKTLMETGLVLVQRLESL
jgi:hypothetical protein